MSTPTKPKAPCGRDRELMRALIDREAGSEVGPTGVALLAAVITSQDRNRHALTPFWTMHLLRTLGISEDALIVTRRRCVEAGWLEYEPGTRGRAARYRVKLPEETNPQKPGQSPASSPPVIRTNPQKPGVVPGESPANPREHQPLPVPHPQEEPPNPPQSRGGGVGEVAPNPEHRLFERFYSAYPRQEKRSAAAAEFARLDPSETLLETMLAAIARQKSGPTWTRAEGRFIPYPAKWLRERRWEDIAAGGAARTEPRTRQEPEPPKSREEMAKIKELLARAKAGIGVPAS